MLLQESELLYYKILFPIWQLALYYEDLFYYEAPISPLQMYAHLFYVGKCSFIRVELPALKKYRNLQQMRETLREYMAIMLLPESEIPPYRDGNSIIEGIYLFDAFYCKINKGKLVWAFLYVNNQDALNLMKKEEKKHGWRG